MTKQNKVAELGDCVAYVTVTEFTFDLRTNGPLKNNCAPKSGGTLAGDHNGLSILVLAHFRVI
jgi:hypothetical protein